MDYPELLLLGKKIIDLPDTIRGNVVRKIYDLLDAAKNGGGVYKLYTDGNRSPEGVTYSYRIEGIGEPIEFTARLGALDTVPVAEYIAIIEGLRAIKDKGTVTIFCDAKVVVGQITGEYEVRAPHLRILRSQLRTEMGKFKNANVSWLKRELNPAG